MCELSRPKIVITRALPDEVVGRFSRDYDVWINPHDRTMTAQEILAVSESHKPDVLIVMAMDRIDSSLIAKLPACIRIIATYSVGHDHIELQAAKARDIAVLSTPDVLSDSVAETAVLLMLGAARRAYEANALIHRGGWTGWTPTQLLGRDLTGARLGIFGMGRIGRAIARKAGCGFDMQVHYHNRSRLPITEENGAIYHAETASFLAQSEFLVLAAPSTPQTIGFLNEKTIAMLPTGAVVVNIARGNLVDDDALIAALQTHHIAAAGLDVFNNEPAIHPGYLGLQNVFLLPHQGSSTLGTRIKMGDMLLESLVALRAGGFVENRLV